MDLSVQFIIFVVLAAAGAALGGWCIRRMETADPNEPVTREDHRGPEDDDLIDEVS